MNLDSKLTSSFRDPSGFLFYYENEIYRQVNTSYRVNYDYFLDSNLYTKLIDTELLIPHQEVDFFTGQYDNKYKIIKPKLIPFISYPYEWSFNQLKDAAITTLRIQKIALDFGMSLKDASSYNIQFMGGKPIFIDTLSFEKYHIGKPWVAYKQFCQHFLAPLALMSKVDIRLNQLLKVFIDGIPLDLASSLLPIRSYFNFPLLTHIHLHSKSQLSFANSSIQKNGKISKFAAFSIIDSLESTINKLKWKPHYSEWANYYEDTNYSSDSFEHKKQIVSGFLDIINPKKVWDLGANNGMFSRIASSKGTETIAFDIDPNAVEKNYLDGIKRHETKIIPLLLDLTNPTPAIGWQNDERMSFLQRGPTDTVLALALIHHLAITNNLPLDKIAEFFGKICSSLIIEFIPKSDSKVQKLLSTREDIFSDYTQENMEKSFSKYFIIRSSIRIKNSERIIYLMRKSNL